MIFLLKWVMFKFQPLNFRGVYCINHLQQKNLSSSSWHICQYFKLSLFVKTWFFTTTKAFPINQRKDSSRPISRLHKEKFHRIRCYSIIIKTQKLPSFFFKTNSDEIQAPTKSHLVFKRFSVMFSNIRNQARKHPSPANPNPKFMPYFFSGNSLKITSNII